MGNALRHVRGESQKNIVRFIEGLSGKYSRWDIWQDFIICLLYTSDAADD